MEERLLEELAAESLGQSRGEGRFPEVQCQIGRLFTRKPGSGNKQGSRGNLRFLGADKGAQGSGFTAG